MTLHVISNMAAGGRVCRVVDAEKLLSLLPKVN